MKFSLNVWLWDTACRWIFLNDRWRRVCGWGVIHILDVDDISSSQEALIIHYLSFFLVYTDSYCTCLLSASWLLISIEWQQPASAAQWRGLELSSEYHKLVFQSRRLTFSLYSERSRLNWLILSAIGESYHQVFQLQCTWFSINLSIKWFWAHYLVLANKYGVQYETSLSMIE